jgi:hypothetical protein
MYLDTSTSLPRIIIGEKNHITFTDITDPNAGGYKWLVVTVNINEIVKKRKQKGEEESKRMTVNYRAGFVANTVLSDLPKEAKENKTMKKVLPVLKKILNKHVDSEGVFPYDKLELLKYDFDKANQIIELEEQKKAERRAKRANKEEAKRLREEKKKEREQRKAEKELKRQIREEKRSQRELRRQQREQRKQNKGKN